MIDGASFKEFTRPWKVIAGLLGLCALILGSYYYNALDWDVPISIIMALCAYFSAPFSMRVILEHQWRRLPAMMAVTWFSVDGIYALYWHFRNPEALLLMRKANFPASLSLYLMCGVIWLYRGTFRQLVADIWSRAR